MRLASPRSTLFLQKYRKSSYSTSMVFKTVEIVQKDFRHMWLAFFKVLALKVTGFSYLEY